MINLKNKSGITLIALMVSIIVIFILVVVNINIALDPEKGVIKKAQETVDQSIIAEEKELIESTWYKLYQTKSIITVNDLLVELRKKDSNWEDIEESGIKKLRSPHGNIFTVNEYECIVNYNNT